MVLKRCCVDTKIDRKNNILLQYASVLDLRPTYDRYGTYGTRHFFQIEQA